MSCASGSTLENVSASAARCPGALGRSIYELCRGATERQRDTQKERGGTRREGTVLFQAEEKDVNHLDVERLLSYVQGQTDRQSYE